MTLLYVLYWYHKKSDNRKLTYPNYYYSFGGTLSLTGRRFAISTTMKKACKYCGGVHDRNYVCDRKPPTVCKKYYQKRNSREDKFRSSYDWQQKRKHILKRDRYLCQACLAGLSGTVSRLTSDGLSVHHIRPLKRDFDLRLSDENLITLCSVHHEMSEKGEIPAEHLLDIVPPTS